MKRIIPFTILLTAVLSSCDNYEASDLQKETFIKYYGVNSVNKGMRVLSTDDDGYIIMGNIDITGRGKEICTIETDEFGNAIRPVKTYGGISDDYGYAFRANSSGYIIAGSTGQEDSEFKDIFLVQIDDAGDTLWTKRFGNPSDDEVYDVLVNDNGNLIITGYSDNTGAGYKRDIFLAEISPEGITEKHEYINLSEDQEAYAIAQAGDKYLLAGYTRGKPDGTTTSNAYLIYGGFSSPWVPTNDTSDGNSIAVSIIIGEPEIQNSDTILNFTVTCNEDLANLDQSQVYLRGVEVEINEDDVPVMTWKKAFGERQNCRIGLAMRRNNEIFMVGNSGFDSEFGDMMLLRTSLDGNAPAYLYLGDDESYTGNGFDFTFDGGFILTGTNKTSEISVITLIKLNSEGSL
ncbi:MAG: hypothetical protein JW894_07440 [Bacteroidales bacterium]|nr:hypothetical protein [Bacteroidales bacterium]